MPVIVLAGEEEFLLSRRAAELKAELVEPAFASFNFIKLVSPPLTEATAAALSLPFGPGKKVVLIERCDLFTKKKGDSPASDVSEKVLKAQLEEFDQALQMVSPQTVVIFACPYNFDASLRTSKIVEKQAKIETFAGEKYYVGSPNAYLETWCRKEAHRHGATIDDQAIHYLLESALDGAKVNLRQVAQEIEKASVYLLPERHISFATVTKLSSHMSHIFALIDFWAGNKKAEALNALNELLAKQPGIPVIATLHTTLSRLIEIKAVAEQVESHLPTGPGINRREIPMPDLARKVAQQMNVQYFLIEKDLRRAKSLSLPWLIAKRQELCQLEYLVKTGQMPDRHALTLFIAA